MSSVHEKVDVRVIKIAFIVNDCDSCVPATCILVFSNSSHTIESSDQINDYFPLFVDML